MVEESDLKQWKDAGHVARRTLEGIKGEIVAGKGWNDVIDSAERFIRRHGGQAAFPVTISVNDMAPLYYQYATESSEGWEREMVFEKGDLVKLDVGVHIKGALGDNAITLEVGNAGNHTDQIKAERCSRRCYRENASGNFLACSGGPPQNRLQRMLDSYRFLICAGIKWKDGACMMGFQFLCTLVGPIIQVSKAQ